MNLECFKVQCPCNLLESLYAYFSHNPQRTQEFIGLVDIVETKGQWILKNIKTCWILMLLPTKKIMGLQSCGNPNFENFRTSNLGVPRQNDIWVHAPWRNTKIIVKGKLMASSKPEPW
jgi:hypothetical protein